MSRSARKDQSGTPRHPIVELIIYRTSLQPLVKEQATTLENMVIPQLPSMDKNHAAKLNSLEPKEMLRKYAPKFVFNERIVSDLSKQYERKESTEVYTILVCFEALQWILNSENPPKESCFVTVLTAIDRIGKTPIQRVLNYIVEQIFRFVMSSRRFKWTNVSFTAAITHFGKNRALEAGFYQIMIQVLKLVVTQGDSVTVTGMMILLDDLICRNAPILIGADFVPVVMIVQPFIQHLHGVGLQVLAHLSKKTDIQALTDSYMMIATSIVGFVANHVLPSSMPGQEDMVDDPEIPQIEAIFDVQYEFLEEFEGIDCFERPKFDMLSERVELADMLSQEAKDKIGFVEDCLVGSSEKALTSFTVTCLAFLKTFDQSPAYFSICAAFFLLLSKFYTRELLDKVGEVVFKTYLFSPKMHVFHDMPLNRIVNTLRGIVYDTVLRRASDQLLAALKAVEDNPFIYTEQLMRIMGQQNRISMRAFLSDEFLTQLVRSSRRLQKLNRTNSSPTVLRARNAQLIFMFELVTNKQTSLEALSSSSLSIGVLRFIFERNLTDTTIISVRNALSELHYVSKSFMLENVVGFLAMTFHACTERSDFPMYQTLAVKLSSAVVTALVHRCELSISFSSLLFPFLRYTRKCPDATVLNNTLRFLTMVATSKKRFEINGAMLYLLLNAIKQVDGDEPSPQTEIHMFNLLCGCLCGLPQTVSLIAVPSILPLIMAVFGRSTRALRIMKFMQSLCDFSDYNKRMCHNGDLDLLILQFVSARQQEATIRYRSCSFPLRFSQEQVKSVLIPLFTTITTVKASSAISNHLINHIVSESDVMMTEVLGRILSQCQSYPSPTFALGACDPQFAVTGLFADDLSNGFTVSFMINIDSQCLKESNINVHILSIVDSEGNSVILFLNQSTLYAKYEAGELRTTVHLKKSLRSSQWTKFTIVFRFLEEQVRLSNFEDSHPLNDSDLCKFAFAPEELTLIVGGTDQGVIPECWLNRQLAVIGALMLFPFPFNRGRVHQIVNTPWEIEDKAIFRSDLILDPSHKNVYKYPRKDEHSQINFFGQVTSYTESTITVNDTLPSPLSLIEVLVNGNECNLLTSVFDHLNEAPNGYPSMILGVLAQLFKRSEQTQRKFEGVTMIRSSLYNGAQHLTAEMYKSIYDLMTEITYEPLQNDWFEILVVDLWLWGRSNYCELHRIIHHWSHVLIPMYSDLFERVSRFSSLLNQYLIFFGSHREGSQEETVPEYRNLLNSTFGKDETKICGDLFLTYLARVARVKLTGCDAGPLFKHIVNWRCKETLLELLRLLFDMSSVVVDIPEFTGQNLLDLHNLIENDDIDIIESTVLVIYQISQKKCHNHMMVLADQFKDHSNPALLFDRLLMRMHEYPNLIYVLCVIALRLGQDKISILARELKEFNNFERLHAYSMWFLLPMLVTLHARKEDRNSICDFIASVMANNTAKFERHMSRICTMLTFIRSVSQFWKSDFMQLLVISLDIAMGLSDAPEIARKVIHSVFRVAFFQLWAQPFHKMVLDTTKGHDIRPLPRPVLMDKLNDLSYIEELIDLKHQNGLLFYLRLSPSREWIDRQLAVLAVSLTSRSDFPKEDEDIQRINDMFIYFSDRNSQTDSQTEYSRDTTMGMAEQVFESNRMTYQKEFNAVLGKCKSLLKKHFDRMRSILSSRLHLLGDESDIMLRAEYSAYGIPAPASKQEGPRYELDPTVCALFCPMKQKVVGFHRKVSEKVNGGEVIAEKNGDLITLKAGAGPVDIRLYRDCFVIVSTTRTRVIANSLVKHILPRKRENTGIEVYLSDGRSYLIDFRAVDICSSFVKVLSKVNIPNCVMVPRPDVFTLLKIKEKWMNWEISNFDYILEINMLSGRSFKDASNYPFFPVLLSNFDDENSVKTQALGDRREIDIKVDPHGNVRSAFKADVVPADFFFRVESIDEVPKWATNAADFIDKLRHILESEEVSKYLHLWLSTYWSIDGKITNGYLFRDKIHPPRKPPEPKESILDQTELKLDHSLVVVSTMVRPDLVTIVTSNGLVMNISVVLGPELQFTLASKPEKIELFDDAVFAENSGTIAMFSSEKNLARMIDSGRVVAETPLFCETETITCVGDLLLFCPDACSIASVNAQSQVKVMCHTLSRIANMIANKVFKVIVVSTIDGYLHIFNLTNGHLVTDVDLEAEANMLIVTHNMGYIIAATNNKIFVLNINGLMLKQVELQEAIVSWYACPCEADSLDYIFFESESHRIGVFNAFHPERMALLHESRDTVSLIMLDNKSGSVVILTRTGKIKIFPVPFNL